VMSPDASITPLPRKNWWLNSEFSGHVMDYAVFELPGFVLSNMGFLGRAFGLFGCSAGGFGSFQVAMKYPHLVNALGAFNSPVYPQECHFAFTCHHVCSSNMMLCELIYTSGAQIFNSYVILFQGSLVVSQSSTDPIAWGTAVHMSANNGYVECKSQENDILTLSQGQGVVLETGSKFFTVADTVTFGIGGKACQYQDWSSPDVEDKVDITLDWCNTLFQSVTGNLGNMEGSGAQESFESGRWTFRTEDNYDGTNPNFRCQTASCNIEMWLNYLPYLPCEE